MINAKLKHIGSSLAVIITSYQGAIQIHDTKKVGRERGFFKSLSELDKVDADAILEKHGVDSDQLDAAKTQCRSLMVDSLKPPFDKQIIVVNAGDEHDKYVNKFLLNYCNQCQTDSLVKEHLIRQNNPKLALDYCKMVADDDDMRQVIINHGDSEHIFLYCAHVNCHNEARQALIDAADPKWACQYCKSISDDADMRQIILDSNDPQWAYAYMFYVKPMPQMRQIIINAADPQCAYTYIKDIVPDQAMIDIVRKNGDDNLNAKLDAMLKPHEMAA